MKKEGPKKKKKIKPQGKYILCLKRLGIVHANELQRLANRITGLERVAGKGEEGRRKPENLK